jgi:hypothetical protein
MSFLMALQRLPKIIKDTKQAITKKGYASPMNLEVGKILRHISLYGSDLKLLLLLLLGNAKSILTQHA